MASSSTETATETAFLRYEVEFSDPVPPASTLVRGPVIPQLSLPEEVKENPEDQSWYEESESNQLSERVRPIPTRKLRLMKRGGAV